MGKHKNIRRKAALLAAAAVGTGSVAVANDTWDGGGANANWSTSANWVDNGTPTQGPGDVITMGQAGALQLTNTVDQNFTIGALNFANSAGYTVNSSGGAALTLSVTTGTAQISSGANTGISTVNVAVNGAAGLVLSPAASTTLAIMSNISTVGQLDRAATTGTLVLGGNNSFAGGFLLRGVTGSTVTGLASDFALGQAGQTITNDSGAPAMIYAVGAAREVKANWSLGNGNANAGVLQFGANDNTSKFDITLSGNITQLTGQTGSPTNPDGNRIDIRENQTVIHTGTFTGSQTLSKIGQGTLALRGNNAGLFTGTLEILNGSVRINTPAALGSAAVVGNTGNAIKLLSDTGSAITLANNFTLSGGGALVLTDTIGAATTTSVMNLNGQVSLSGAYGLNVESNNVATINGKIVNGGTAGQLLKGNPGTLILAGNNEYTGGTALNVGGLRAATDTAFGTGTITASSSQTTTFLSAAGDRTFANNVVLGGTNTVQFGQALFTNGNMKFNGPVSLTGLNVDPAPTNTADDYKPLAVAAGVNVTFGNTISEVNVGSGITKAGPGTLTLTGNNTFTGPINITGTGAVVVNGTNLANAVVGAGSLRGTGTVRLLSISDNTVDDIANGGTLSPGDDATAATFVASRAAFDNGGRYLFNLTNAGGVAGTGWDLLQLNGVGTPNANIDVGATAGGFELEIASLDPTFDNAVAKNFQIVGASGVTNFTPGDIFVDYATVTGLLGGGTFSVVQNGTNLDLSFTPVPEPTSMAAVLLAAGALMRRRSRKV
jgi:fibronectin-binding autotransporter adhesin